MKEVFSAKVVLVAIGFSGDDLIRGLDDDERLRIAGTFSLDKPPAKAPAEILRQGSHLNPTMEVGKSTAKIVRYAGTSGPEYGLLEGSQIYELLGDIFGAFTRGAAVTDRASARFLPPVRPGKIILTGYNYAGHAEELKKIQPQDPLIFLKAPTAVIGDGADVVYPRDAQNVSYEGELVVVIGRRCRRVREADAGDVILGYSCGNDVTDRDLQKKDVQYARAKSFDSFGPLGPCIATGIDASRLRIQSRLNGEIRQDSNTSLLIHSPATLVSWASQSMTLEPGDVIFTGTPTGVGAIVPGDVMEVEIEGIGVLRNRVVAESVEA